MGQAKRTAVSCLLVAFLFAAGACEAAPTQKTGLTTAPTAPGMPSDPSQPLRRIAANGRKDLRADNLLERIRSGVPASLHVADSASIAIVDPGSAGKYQAGLLLQGKTGRYSSISAEYTDPPPTSGDPDCAPWESDCSTRNIHGGVAHINGTDQDPTFSVAVYRDDRSMPLILHSTRDVTQKSSIFWQGGAPSQALPISVDEAINLAQDIISLRI